MELVSDDRENKKRNPFSAAFMSLILMGLGQFYNGQPRRACAYFTLEILSLIFIVTSAPLFQSYHGLIIYFSGLSIYAGIRIFAIFDAFKHAWRIGETELHRYNRWYFYVPMLLIPFVLGHAIEQPVLNYQPYNIPSGSMIPNLLIGDHVWATKNTYTDHAPERGDVVVFKLPSYGTTDFIQRIVGLPGDRVQMIAGRLWLNGIQVKRERNENFIFTNHSGRIFNQSQFIETLPGGQQYRILEITDHEALDNTPAYTVPEGHYFTLGDNRDNSRDSRLTSPVGYIPKGNLFSRPEYLYFSTNGSAHLWQIWRWPSAVRFGRLGTRIN